MNNVYEEVGFFYNEYDNFDAIVKQNWVEKFLRKKAWAGRSDADMRMIWKHIKNLFSYMEEMQVHSINEMTGVDYVRAFLWLAEHNAVVKVTETQVKDFLFALRSFYQYLDAEINTSYMHELYAAMKYFYINGKFQIPQLDTGYDKIYDNLDRTDGITAEDAEHLNVLLETLLNKIGLYYKSKQFSLDFNRALALYAGPLNEVPDDDGEEFWLGFWDYFLFDYHLIKSDVSPLQHFYNTNKDVLQATELRILQDLLKAEFTVFYINYIRDDDMVECTNLFTQEHIQLPQPDFGLCDYKKVLLYGHIYLKGVVMLNYIPSVPASKNLRKRIQEEVSRQHAVYQYQDAAASLSDFFERHAIVVRHTIDILVRLAKVNVVSPNLLAPASLKFAQCPGQPDEKATSILKFLAERYHFSLYATNMLFKMWQHVCAALPVSALPESRALSVFLSFTTINGVNFINKKLLMSRLNVKKEDFQDECEKIANALQLRIFDPRYLTEEGFVLSLYAF